MRKPEYTHVNVRYPALGLYVVLVNPRIGTTHLPGQFHEIFSR